MGKHNVPPPDKLAYYLLKSVNKAIRDHAMIADGDRVAVAVSGGKDSLTLLRLLQLRQQSVLEKHVLLAVHVQMTGSGGVACHATDTRGNLESYLEQLGQEYVVETVDLPDGSTCFRCSYLRRKALFMAARRLGCNKVALGHHADDAAETTLMNLLFHGRVETLYPKRSFFSGKFDLIRPMIYVPEKDIVRFARAAALPMAASSCPISAGSRRTLVKGWIRAMDREYPRVKINLFRAGLRGEPEGEQ